MADSEWTIHILPSSHNDIGWAGTPSEIAEHREKNIIDRVLEMMSEDSRYCFAMEATLYLDEYAGRRPDRINEIRRRVASGQLEWGGSYIQPYESLHSGEALLRQIYYGKGELERRWGIRTTGAWNVDIEGRAIQLPQILGKSGIDYLVVSRNEPGLYWWEAPDGTRVLVLSLMEGHYGQSRILKNWGKHHSPLEAKGEASASNADPLEEAAGELKALIERWRPYFDAHDIPKHILLCATADYTVPEKGLIAFADAWNDRAEQWRERYGLSARMVFSNVASYIADLNRSSDLSRLSVVRGELPNPWLYIHGPGHEKAISAMRAADTELLLAEQLSVVVDHLAATSTYPRQALDAAWKCHLYPDHGWGGLHGVGTDEVFRYQEDRALSVARQIAFEKLEALGTHAGLGPDELIVYNPLSWERSDWVRARVALPDGVGRERLSLTDDRGAAVVFEIDSIAPAGGGHVDIAFTASGIPGLGYRIYRLGGGRAANEPVAAVGHATTASPQSAAEPAPARSEHLDEDFVWENETLRCRVTPGGILELFDRARDIRILDTSHYLGGEVIELGSPGIDVGEGEHVAVWNWQKVRPYQPTAENVRRTKYEGGRVRVLRRSTLSATVETRARFEHCTVVQTFTFIRDHDWIDLTIDLLGWDGTHARELRVVFPFSRENAHIVYEGPFQHINAGSDEVQPFESMRPREVQNFIQASADGISLTLSGSTVAYDWIDPLDSERRSLLQSVLMATKRSCHSRGNWYEQEGSHRFQFRISASSLTPVARHRFGWGAASPLRVVQGREATDESAGGARKRGNPSKAAATAARPSGGVRSFLAVDCDHVMITALKAGAEPGSTVVRLWEFRGEDVLVRLSLPVGIAAAERGGLIETSGEPREGLRIASGTAEVAIKRNEIVTIHLYTNVPSRR